jgi:hypothetical protein
VEYKKNKIKMSKTILDQVKEYVDKNYPAYKNQQLTIKELGSHFRVYKHIDGSPLILSKQIIK